MTSFIAGAAVMAALTGGGLFGEPWDSLVSGTAAIAFLYAAWKIVRLNPPRGL